jgi:hypothetical protein
VNSWKTILLAALLAAGFTACDADSSSTPDVTHDAVELVETDSRVEETTDAGPTPDDRFGETPAFDEGDQRVEDLFHGVRLVHRQTETPRPLSYHLVLIDPSAEGIDFTLTPDNGDDQRETTRQTTLSFTEAVDAQVAINAHFFRPWPSQEPYADLAGLGASDGHVYSLFEGAFNQAFVTTTDGAVHIVEQAAGDDTGAAVTPEVPVDDAIGSNERIIRDGTNTATWEELHPRTAIGITSQGHIVAIVVDGRQDGISEGMTTLEVADVLLEFNVEDAINLDGGGSSTLVVANPEPIVVNTPVGLVFPGTERENGSNFAIFAQPQP